MVILIHRLWKFVLTAQEFVKVFKIYRKFLFSRR